MASAENGTPVHYPKFGELQADSARKLFGEVKTWVSGFVFSWDMTHTYNNAGNRTLKTDLGVRTTFTYDAANQLSTMEEATRGTTTYIYDSTGNRRIQIGPSGNTTFIWDTENMLVRADLPTNSTNLFIYNGDLRRVGKTDSLGACRSVFDGSNYLLETTPSGVVQAEYTQTINGYGDLVGRRQNGASDFRHYDGLGSTVNVTDRSQTVTEQNVYEAYGEERSGGLPTNPFRFVGQEQYHSVNDIAFILLGRRFYDPQSGVFISRDPLGPSVIGTLYSYCGNNPVLFIDPAGLEQVEVLVSPPQWEEAQSILKRHSPNSNQHNDFQEVMDGILGKLRTVRHDNTLEYCDCVKLIEFGAHGTPKGVGLADDWPDSFDTNDYKARMITHKNIGFIAKELGRRVPFCRPCTIRISACNAGLGYKQVAEGTGVPWLQVLANLTGCTVIAAGGYCSGKSYLASPDKKLPQVKKYKGPSQDDAYYNSNNKGLYTNPGDDKNYASEADKWYTFVPDNPELPTVNFWVDPGYDDDKPSDKGPSEKGPGDKKDGVNCGCAGK